MGNNHLHGGSGSPGYNPQLADWENISNGHGAPLWRNRSTGEELDEYKYMTQSSNDLRRLRNLFDFRHNSPVLVATRFFNDAPQQELCGNHHLVSMLAERMHLRLNQINDVPYPDVLHMYWNALHGYHELYKKTGYFPINENMIGINKQGRVKVWLHSDFSHDRPDKDASSFTKSQDEMVLQIIQIIDRNIDHTTSPENIAKFLLEQPLLTFSDAINMLNIWQQKHLIAMPDRLNTIANMIRSGHFGKMSPSRRTDQTIIKRNNSNHLQNLHGLLTAQQKSHLPPGSKIVTTQTQEIISAIIAGALINPLTEVSAIPIFGHTLLGLRPLSPARIVIRAHSPIRNGLSALEIRPHSPLPGQYTQLHPLLSRQNMTLSSKFMHPRDATIVAPISPLVRSAESVFTHNRSTQINNEELLVLRKRIQSELQRVNALVNASQINSTHNIKGGYQRVSSQQKGTATILPTTTTPTIPPNRRNEDRQIKPMKLNSSYNVQQTTDLNSKKTSPVSTIGITTVQPTYKAKESARGAATPSLSPTRVPYTPSSLVSSYQPTGATNVVSYGSSQKYTANVASSLPPTVTVSPAKQQKITLENKSTQRRDERSPLSSTTQGPKIVFDDKKHIANAGTNSSSANNHNITTFTSGLANTGDNRIGFSSDNTSYTNFKTHTNNTTLTSHTAVPTATTTTATTTTTTMMTNVAPYNTNRTSSSYKAAIEEIVEGISTFDSSLVKKVDTQPIKIGTDNFFESLTGRNRNNYYTSGSYHVDSPDTIHRDSVKSATESVNTSSHIRRSFDKNINVIRISAGSTNNNTSGEGVISKS